MTDLSSIRIKKKKSPTVRTKSQNKYKDFIKSFKKSKSKRPVQSIMHKSLKKTEKLPKHTKRVEFDLNPKYDNPEISLTKRVRVVNNPPTPIFRLDRNEPVKVQRKKQIVKKKLKNTKKRKRKPRKVSFVVKPKSKKKTRKRSKSEMVDTLKKKGITLSKPNDDMIEKLFACIEDSGISIEKS